MRLKRRRDTLVWTFTGKVARGPIRNSWAGNTFRKAVCGGSTAAPKKQSVLFADNLYGQTTDEFKRVLKEECNTLLWLLPPKCTDEVQLVDAGYGKLFKVYVGKALDAWLLNGDNVEKGESNKLTASDRRILITQWTGEAAKHIDRDIRYRRRLFEKTGLAMTADGSDDNLINLQGVEQGTYSFMDVDTSPQPLEDVLQISPAPADEQNPPGSSDEDESETEEEGVMSGGQQNRLRPDVDELATLDIDDDVTRPCCRLKSLLVILLCAQHPPPSLGHSSTNRFCFGLVWAGSGG